MSHFVLAQQFFLTISASDCKEFFYLVVIHMEQTGWFGVLTQNLSIFQYIQKISIYSSIIISMFPRFFEFIALIFLSLIYRIFTFSAAFFDNKISCFKLIYHIKPDINFETNVFSCCIKLSFQFQWVIWPKHINIWFSNF